jgi:PhnB protein
MKVNPQLAMAKSPQAAEVPADWGAKVYHATLKVGDTAIMASDQPTDRYEPPRGFDIVLQVGDPDAAERVFNGLAEGGTIKMPLQETFWARRFGALVDRFGIRWVVNCEQASETS